MAESGNPTNGAENSGVPFDPATWRAVGHDARFPHCAGCGAELDPQFSADGDVIVSLGLCVPCGRTTAWEIVNAGGDDK